MSSDLGDLDDFESSDEYIMGERGEQLVEELIKQNGWKVLPSRLYAREGAPCLESLDERYVLPDLWVADGYGKEQRFVEIKTKDKPVHYYIKDQLRHGFEAYLYDQYRAVQRETGCKVWIFVYEESSGELLRKPLEDLHVVQREDEGDARLFDAPAVLFLRDNFDPVELYSDERTFGQSKLGEMKEARGGVFGESLDEDGQQGLGDFPGGGG